MSIGGWRNAPATPRPKGGKPPKPAPTLLETLGMDQVNGGQMDTIRESNGVIIEQTAIASAMMSDDQRATAAGMKSAAENYNKVRKMLKKKLAKVD